MALCLRNLRRVRLRLRLGCPAMMLRAFSQALPKVTVLPGGKLQRRGIVTSDLSYVEGPTEPPLLQHTIPEHFATIVSQYGDQPAVIVRSPAPASASLTSTTIAPTTTLTYAALDALSNTTAHSLRSLGVKKGDRVAVSLGNVAEYAVLTYAIFKLGAILVPLNPGFNAQQLGAALSHLEVEVLVIGAVTDLAYKPCRGRSNLGLLSELLPNLAGGGGGGGKVEAPSVPTLKSVVVVDNRASHPEALFPLENLPSLTPFEQLLPLPNASLSLSSSTRPVTADTPLHPSETINIQFTSGTTSGPKAAMLTHTGILNNGRLIAQRMGLDPSDRVVCPPPLFHCFGCVLGYMATATTGAALLLPSPAFDPAAALRMAAEHRATALYGVATMFVAELDLLSEPAFRRVLEEVGGKCVLDSGSSSSSSSSSSRGSGNGGGESDGGKKGLASHLRKGIAAGSSVPEALTRRLFDALGLDGLVICYGMTETSPVSAMTAPADPLAKRTRTVGRAMPHTALKVVSPADRGAIVPRGARGELAASGYLVMRGYWGDEAQTRKDLVHDDDVGGGGVGVGVGRTAGLGLGLEKRVWMYTGDEACMDEDGYVEITGRIKDLIIRGGENVHPLEVENCLLQHPLVRDASVVGVPDERHGEAVGAFIVPTHDAVTIVDGGGSSGDDENLRNKKVLSKDELKEWVRKNLSSHLVPKHVFWIDEYPKTASGKIQKFKLRDMAKELVTGKS